MSEYPRDPRAPRTSQYERPVRRRTRLTPSQRTDRALRRGAPLITLFFAIPLFLLAILALVLPKPTVSASENRTLATMPAFSLESLFSGKFMRDFESFYTDTFPFRESMLSAATDIKGLAGIKGEEELVFVQGSGDDLGSGEGIAGEEVDPTPTPSVGPTVTPSALASANPTPSAASTPAPTPTPPADDLAQEVKGYLIVGTRGFELYYYNEDSLIAYAETLNDVAAALPGKKVYSLIAPTALEFYAPAKYRTDTYSQKKAYDTVTSHLKGVTPVKAYDKIAAHTNEELYFNTDHHWTALGAYYGYTAFAEAAGFTPRPLSDYTAYTVDGFIGSLYRMTNATVLRDNPDSLTYYEPIVEYEAVASDNADFSGSYRIYMAAKGVVEDTTNKYLIFMQGDHAVAKIDTENNTGKKILVIKESYGNAFVPWLLPHYDEIHVFDPRRSQGMDISEYMDQNDIDELLFINYTFAAGSKSFRQNVQKIK